MMYVAWLFEAEKLQITWISTKRGVHISKIYEILYIEIEKPSTTCYLLSENKQEYFTVSFIFKKWNDRLYRQVLRWLIDTEISVVMYIFILFIYIHTYIYMYIYSVCVYIYI